MVAAPSKKNQKINKKRNEMKENEIKRKKASSESYIDAVASAENVVGCTTDRWQKRPDRQKNPSKEILSRIKRNISLI